MISSIRLFFLALTVMNAGVLPARLDPAQEAGASQAISGVVRDASGGVMTGVLVSIPALKAAADTDSSGRYSLNNVPPGKVVLRASFPGFKEKEIAAVVQPGQDLALDITLELQSRTDTVTVEVTSPKLMTASDSIGVVTVLPQQVSTLPSLGEKDIFRAFQLMPGISASNESSSGLYVRGGTPDQNLVLYDGFTLYKVDHFFGIFSAFNSNTVENTTILKGGFDSKYGGRISSVLDIVGRSGRKDKTEIGGGISLLSYNAYMDGPLGTAGSYLVAFRRSYQSPFSKKIRDSYTTTNGPGGAGGPGGMFSSEPSSSFYDVNARMNFSVTAKDNVVLSLYHGKDNYDNSRTISLPSFGSEQTSTLAGSVKDISYWGNTGSSISWIRNWSSIYSTQFTLAYSSYFKEAENSSNMKVGAPSGSNRSFDNSSSEKNDLKDVTFRLGNSVILGRKHYLEFGAESVSNQVDYHFNFNEGAADLLRNNRNRQQAFYLQDRLHPFDSLEITPGLRVTRYNLTQQVYLEPRLNFIYHASDKLRFKAAGGRFYQYTNDLTREDPMGGDQDFWTLADGSTVPVSRANHYIGGASYETRNYLFDLEAYRKDLKGLTEFGMFRGFGPPPDSDTSPPEKLDFSRAFFTGSGVAKGVEFLAQKKFGADTGWFTYTFGRVMHDFPGLYSYPYPASHDSTHEIKIVNSYSINRLTISGNWIFATGKPITEPTGSEEITTPNGRTFYIPVFGAKNGSRLPDYHRLDVSAYVDFHKEGDNRAQAGVSVFNTYNRHNVWRRQYQYVDGEKLSTDVNYLGLTFSAFLNFNFLPPEKNLLDVNGAYTLTPATLGTVTKSSSSSKAQLKLNKTYDLFGKVQSIDRDRVRVQVGDETREFVLGRSVILGEENYEEGALVHIYYRRQTDGDVATMMLRKITNTRDIPAASLEPLDPLRPRRY
jgi:ferric enterobactin receptor